jgi:hypothetical protein
MDNQETLATVYPEEKLVLGTVMVVIVGLLDLQLSVQAVHITTKVRIPLMAVTTLDNDDINISMSHVLLFPKIYNLFVCHTIKANRQKSIPC